MARWTRRLYPWLLAVLFLAACGSRPPAFKGTVLNPPKTATDFTLTDQTGQPFTLNAQQGSVVLLYFGYTACPDVCPTTLGTWKQVAEQLGADAARVRFVFVTVDPERDTVEQLGRYLPLFSPDFVGLTGTPEALEPVYQAYAVYHQKVLRADSALGYLVDHTATTYVIDPTGTWRLLESYGTPAEDIVHDVQLLLK